MKRHRVAGPRFAGVNRDRYSSFMATRKRPTIRAIAEALAISPGTVSRSLRDHPGVHPELRQKIRATAESMGYVVRANRINSRNGTGRTKIGVIVGDMVVLHAGAVDTSYVAYHFLSGLSQASNDAGAVLSVAFLHAASVNDNSEPQQELGFLDDVDGVALIYPLPESFVAKLVKVTNVVSFEHAYPTLPVDVVGPAQATDVMRAVDQLLQKGHRRIAYTADDAARGNRLPQTLRFAGFLSALRRGGIEYRKEDVLGIPGASIPATKLAAAVADRVKAGVTAVVCSTDRQAYLLLKELASFDIRVPEDLSVIGIGGVTPIEGLSQLTMYRTPYDVLGRAALSRLSRRGAEYDPSPVLKEFPGTYIEGTSVGPPRKDA